MDTDIEAIESHKENVLPLSSGRSASKLAGLLSRDKRSRDAELEQGHLKFQREIQAVEADSEADDPLDAYHRYIRWTLQSYPSGPSHASHLVPLLEKTTRRFVQDARYKADIRYLRLWILYSKYIDAPRDVYRFLEANDIGSSLASFYEEWAAIEETANNIKEAYAIFDLGVARRAEPLARLKKRRDAFQAKVVLSPPQDAPSPQTGEAAPRRTGLSSSSSSAPMSAPVSKPNGAAFAVFSDAHGSDTRSGTWDDLGTRDERRRENHLDAKPWVGETIPMSQGKAVPQIEKLEVFRDEDVNVPLAKVANEPAIAVKSIRAPSEAESLRANPFKYYNAAQVQSAIEKTPSSLLQEPLKPKASSKNKTTLKPKKSATSQTASNKRERVASPLAEVYPEDALGREEFSFEEIYALRRAMRTRDGTVQASMWTRMEGMQWYQEALAEATPFHVDANGEAILYDANGRGTFRYIREEQDAEARRQAAEEEARQKRMEEERRLQDLQRLEEEQARQEAADNEAALRRSTRQPSPTILTKRAMEDMGDLFGATMAFDSPADSSFRSSSLEPSSDLDELPPSSQAEDFNNDSFWGAPSSQSQPWTQPSQPSNPLLDGDDVESDSDMASLPVRQFEKLQIWQDENASHVDSAVPLSNENKQQKPLGSRFAPLVDLMTPITERTAEYRQSLLNAHPLRASVGPAQIRSPQLLVRDDEDETSREDESTANEGSTTLGDIAKSPENTTAADTSHFMSTKVVNLTLEEPEAHTIAKQADNSSTNMLIVNESQTESPSFPNPCQPQSKKVLAAILGDDKAALHSLPEYHLSGASMNKSAALQKNAKKRKKTSSASTADDCGFVLDLAPGTSFSVREKLGEGGFGAVYRVADADIHDTSIDEDKPSVFALKVTQPAMSWEFYALHVLRERLAGTRASQSLIEVFGLFEFQDESFLLLEVLDQGTLLSAVNSAPTAGLSPLGGAPGVDELLAMFFTVELLRLLDAIHSCGFVHGDFKIDNVMVRLDEVPGGSKAWLSAYKADGSDGWCYKGVKLIDFGRAIDLHVFPANQTFEADFDANGRDCLQMRQGRPWRFESDYHGLAAVAFTLLFGKHLEAEHTVLSASGEGLVLAGKPFRRYHQTALWTRLFNVLLDPGSSSDAAVEIAAVRREMEAWLEANAEKGGRPLKSLLRKLEIAQLSKNC